MSQFLHHDKHADNNVAKVISIPQVFSENIQAKNLPSILVIIFSVQSTESPGSSVDSMRNIGSVKS